MLPIDEHAKSGAEIYVELRHDNSLRRVVYDPETDTFYEPTGEFWELEQITGCYLPASWVENAGKMREALDETHSNYGTCSLVRNPKGKRIREKNADMLAATEWPKGEK